MFDNLTSRFSKIVRTLTGQGRLTEKNIDDALSEVRAALYEADVSSEVVKTFIEAIRARAVGQAVMEHLSPGQMVIKIVHEELVRMMGEHCAELNLVGSNPAIILMAGLQGSGKTTSLAKLALFLKEKQRKSVLITSTDIYRPAAIEQLRILADQIGVSFFSPAESLSPVEIAAAALEHARRQHVDVLIVDSAGRLTIDEPMMTEIKNLHAALQPIETLFVVDSMTGQIAVNTARAFNDALPLTGVILTKADGDARGGAALSIRATLHKPIKFIGVGEKITALEPFYPERIASRILGMGDVLTLIEEAKEKIDHAKAEKISKKIMKGHGFDLEDFLVQIQQMKKMGGVSSLLDKLPGMGQLPAHVRDQANDKNLAHIEAMIYAMTPQERRFPDIIRGSRKRRITQGSGTKVEDLNKLLKQFSMMQKVMKQLGKGGSGLMNMMQRLKGGGFPGQFG